MSMNMPQPPPDNPPMVQGPNGAMYVDFNSPAYQNWQFQKQQYNQWLNDYQQAQRDDQNRQLTGQGLGVELARQQYASGQQGVYNTISSQNANQQLAATGLNFAGDLARMQNEIAQQQVGNTRYVQGLNFDVDRASNQLAGAVTDAARSRYMGANTEINSSYDRALRRLGY